MVVKISLEKWGGLPILNLLDPKQTRLCILKQSGSIKSPPHFFAEIVGQENDGAIAGRLPSEEEQARIFKEFLETDFVVDQLEKVRAHKEKLLKKLESAGE